MAASEQGQARQEEEKPILILGVGNLLLSDEGFGVHMAQRLERESWPADVEVMEGGTDGFRLMNVIRGRRRLIVIDAIKGGEQPGTLYRFDYEDAPASRIGRLTSAHQVGILEILQMMTLIGDVPQATFLGIEPATLTMGMELSPVVEAKIPRVIELLREELARAPQSR